jgi:short-subunit dehydrogenase
MTMSPPEQAGTLKPGGGAALHPCASLSSLCAGKAALRMWALTLAEDLTGTGVQVGTVTVYGPVERGTAFDPDDIAAALVRLHRGTNEGVEIHFTHGTPASGRPERSTGSVAPT